MPEPNLKELPPEERIKKLKELEKQKKKEIEDAQKLIKDSEVEITERHKFKEKVPIPEVAAADLKELTEQEQEIVRTHRGLRKENKSQSAGIEEAAEEEAEEARKKSRSKSSSKEEMGLEELTARERADIDRGQLLQAEYTRFLSQKPMQSLYDEVKGIKAVVEDKGYINHEEERRIAYLSSAVERKVQDVQAGKYSFTEDVAMAASLTLQIGSKLKSLYRSEEDGERRDLYR